MLHVMQKQKLETSLVWYCIAPCVLYCVFNFTPAIGGCGKCRWHFVLFLLCVVPLRHFITTYLCAYIPYVIYLKCPGSRAPDSG
jgi:hypothetical protein